MLDSIAILNQTGGFQENISKNDRELSVFLFLMCRLVLLKLTESHS
jgi:hypothetical protein